MLSISKMLLKIAIAAAIATPAAQTATALPLSERGELSTRIVGGIVAPQGAFPFIVSLSRNGEHFCGGSLLNADTVLTASHCVVNTTLQIQVRAGSHVSFFFSFYIAS